MIEYLANGTWPVFLRAQKLATDNKQKFVRTAELLVGAAQLGKRRIYGPNDDVRKIDSAKISRAYYDYIEGVEHEYPKGKNPPLSPRLKQALNEIFTECEKSEDRKITSETLLLHMLKMKDPGSLYPTDTAAREILERAGYDPKTLFSRQSHAV